MLSEAFVVAAVSAGAAALITAARAIRAPRRAVPSVLLFLLAGACVAQSRAYVPGGWPGSGMGPLLADATVMVAVFAVLALLIFTSQPPAEALPRAGHRLSALAVFAAGMIICVAFGAAAGVTLALLAYFTLYVVFLGAALAEVLVLSWQHAKLAWHQRGQQAGLLIVCLGAVAGLGGLAGQTVLAGMRSAHHAAPPLGGAACPGLTATPQCVLTVTVPSAAVMLTVAGATVPVLAGTAAIVWRYSRYLLMLRTLEPLWDELKCAFPQVGLPERSQSRLNVAFRAYRRVIEIGDARVLLRPYIRPEVTAIVTQATTGFGLRGEDLHATVEAAEIVTALRAHRAVDLDDYTRPPDHSDANVDDLSAEAAWLVKVARAYATSPLVYQLVIHRR